MSRLGLVGREATTITCFWPGKSVVFIKVRACIFVVDYNIRIILGYIERGHISVPDNVTRMKIYWQIKKKWQVLFQITAKTCITLQRVPLLVLPTSGPIPHVLGCGLTSHFGDLKTPILQCCRNSSDLSDNRTFFMKCPTKNVRVPDQMSDKKYKNVHLWDETKQTQVTIKDNN